MTDELLQYISPQNMERARGHLCDFSVFLFFLTLPFPNCTVLLRDFGRFKLLCRDFCYFHQLENLLENHKHQGKVHTLAD